MERSSQGIAHLQELDGFDIDRDLQYSNVEVLLLAEKNNPTSFSVLDLLYDIGV